MAVTGRDQVLNAIGAKSRVDVIKNSAATATNAYVSTWTSTPNGGVAPGSTAGVVPTKSTFGALQIPNAAGSLFLARAQIYAHVAGWLFFADRLVHSDSLSGTTTGAQTVGTPSLTRYTDGAGVELWLEIYSALGATPQTVTASYTDNVNGASRTTQAVSIPASAAATRAFPLPLQAGDFNPISVQSVTLAGSTGTAGSFGITMLRRHASIAVVDPTSIQLVESTELGLPQVDNNACLSLLLLSTATGTPQIEGTIDIVDL